MFGIVAREGLNYNEEVKINVTPQENVRVRFLANQPRRMHGLILYSHPHKNVSTFTF